MLFGGLWPLAYSSRLQYSAECASCGGKLRNLEKDRKGSETHNMCNTRIKRVVSAGKHSLYDLYFDEKLYKTGLTMDEVRRELRKKEEGKK